MIAVQPVIASVIPAVRDLVNTASTGAAEEVLKTYSIPANFFNAQGKGLIIRFGGLNAANANAKTYRIRLGATGLGGTALFTFAGVYNALWYSGQIEISRRALDTQNSTGFVVIQTNAGPTLLTDAESGTAANTEANALIVALTGAGVAAGDVNCDRWSIDKYAGLQP